VLTAVDAVAGILGNTRSVCRKCYIHPEILSAYMDRTLGPALATRNGRRVRSPYALSQMESAVLCLLQKRLKKAA
jgi:DNA topoisomerase-1